MPDSGVFTVFWQVHGMHSRRDGMTSEATNAGVQEQQGGVRRDGPRPDDSPLSAHAASRMSSPSFTPDPSAASSAKIPDLLQLQADLRKMADRIALDRYASPGMLVEDWNQELGAEFESVRAAYHELESRNRQLETTVQQVLTSNENLQTANRDLLDVLTSVNIPILVVTAELRIRQFTPAMRKLADLEPGNVGGTLEQARFHFTIDTLDSQLQAVLEHLTPQEIEFKDHADHWHVLRIRPYRTAGDRIDGLVLLFFDIDPLRRSQQESANACEFLESVFESVPVPLAVVQNDARLHTANRAFRSMTRMRLPALTGRSLPGLLTQLWGDTPLQVLLADLCEQGRSFEFEHTSTTADEKILLVKGQLVWQSVSQPVRNGGQSAALVSIEDITARRKAEMVLHEQRLTLESAVQTAAVKLDRTEQELRSLTAHLFTVQEEERQKVARELHDDISQRLSFLELLLKEVPTDGSGPTPSEVLQEARQHVSALNTNVRGISHQLHPAILDDLGLSAALRSLVTEFARREDMVATYISHEVPELPRQPAIAAIYRIAQEALRNVAKHAGKTHVKIILEADDRLLRLQVVDLGTGFDQDPDGPESAQGLGMISMKERAHMAGGSLAVRSSLGYGTTVTAEIPFDAQA